MAVDVFKLVGQTLDAKYRIDAVVAEGGFGVVYRGFHERFRQAIAIKCLKVPAHFTTEARALFFEQFRAEGEHLARLSTHPAIVRVFDLGTLDRRGSEVPYLVLEWLEGQDLEAHVGQRGREGRRVWSEAEIVTFLRPGIEALALAHKLRIAHRDIKPANLFLSTPIDGDGDPVLKVLDFGIAKAMQEGETATQIATRTSSGFNAFSPQYGAPEQFRPKKYGATGPWTDVHAVGLILVELATGRTPFEGEEVADFLIAAIDPERPSPRARGASVSDAFESVCTKALALNPRERFQSARELLDALGALTPAPIASLEPQRSTRDTAVSPPPASLEPQNARTIAASPLELDAGLAEPEATQTGEDASSRTSDQEDAIPESATDHVEEKSTPSRAEEEPLLWQAGYTLARLRRNPGAGVAGVFLVMLVVLAIYAVVRTFGSGQARAPSEAPPPKAAEQKTCRAGESLCGDTCAAVCESRTLVSFWRSTCALRPGGQVWCWGSSIGLDKVDTSLAIDACGSGSYQCSASPRRAPSLDGTRSIKVATNGPNRRICFVGGSGAASDSVIKCIDQDTERSTCILESGVVRCGSSSNSFGELGNGTLNPRDTPTAVGRLGRVTQLQALGRWSWCALETMHQVHCWGSNSLGRLGFASKDKHCKGGQNDAEPTECEPTPVVLPWIDIVSLRSGWDEGACVIHKSGAASCWLDQRLPFELTTGDTKDAMTTGEGACALKNDGDVVCAFGYGGRPTVVLDHATTLEASNYNWCAERLGDVLCWGRNANAALGLSSWDGPTVSKPALLRFEQKTPAPHALTSTEAYSLPGVSAAPQLRPAAGSANPTNGGR